MSTRSIAAPGAMLSKRRRKLADRVGEPGLRGLTWLAAAAATALIALLIYKVFAQSSEAFSTFGLGFVGKDVWDPTHAHFGAAAFLYGTAVTTAGALLIGGPTAIAISLFLTEMAPRRVRRPIAMLVDLLAAIPSVVLGLWGIIVLCPFAQQVIEPVLKSVLGWIPLFASESSPFGLVPAILVLTIMAVPIISAVTREVFETVPGPLREGALALGATRWEMVRMVVLPYSRNGIVGGLILGIGRALGEAIAVTMVVGKSEVISHKLFEPGSTLASQIADSYQGATTHLEISSLLYLGAVLLVLAVIVNLVARLIVRRSSARGGIAAASGSTVAATPVGGLAP